MLRQKQKGLRVQVGKESPFVCEWAVLSQEQKGLREIQLGKSPLLPVILGPLLFVSSSVLIQKQKGLRVHVGKESPFVCEWAVLSQKQKGLRVQVGKESLFVCEFVCPVKNGRG